MAAGAGLAVANIYYNQPMLALIERDFPGSTVAGMISTATQLGYAAGLFLLVPLGDVLERRRLILVQFVALAVALAVTAVAPGPWSILLGSLAIGVAATVAQQIVPFAANLAAPTRRGATIGTVMSGLLCGILLSRTVAGLVATQAGWRAMFWLGVPIALIACATMAAILPQSRPAPGGPRYGGLLRSLVDLWRRHPALRLAAWTQAGLFAAFTMFWTILALHLQEPQYRLGAAAAGLFGMIGAVGVLVAPLAGRIADRRGPRAVVMIGVGTALAGWLVIAVRPGLAGMIVGVVLIDFGVQSALIANQAQVYALDADARNRLNTILMGGMFLGGSAGSLVATLAWAGAGWSAVTAAAILFCAVAAILQARRQSTPISR
ncbi:MAG TPA: MFS transporter [Sphingomonas sp.]|jgi:predicted MFS family arabinose efflux permease|uniref:MFS transporter n=1 Tax=Sphingomonas sp. TaxID=28214 RepID=UPI002ED983C1